MNHPLRVVSRRQPAAWRTLFTTEHAFDAGLAGFDGPEASVGDDGGFAVHFDARGSLPQVVIQGSDGEVVVTGYAAIRELCNAIMSAEQLALRMGGA